MRILIAIFLLTGQCLPAQDRRPNIILLMSDDQGWGETGYRNHPNLRTPQLDAMAANGLRLDHFYAGSPLCSPTRASVLTGRNNDRTGVLVVGQAMRLQEKTIAQTLQQAGYATAHFGKWHLSDAPETWPEHHGFDGFDYWLATTNFFDRNPILSRNGQFVDFSGGPSETIVREALRFIDSARRTGRPFFLTIWFGSPHQPWVASEDDRKAFAGLDSLSQHHYGELVELDRSIGDLRRQIHRWGIADNTLLWFNSDNGGVKPFAPAVNGGLRGFKGDVYEGGIRVPCLVEWPARIKKPRVSDFPAVTMDIFPTLAHVAGLPPTAPDYPMDGTDILYALTSDTAMRRKPIPFRYQGKAAWVDFPYKLVSRNYRSGRFELYNLQSDPLETTDLFSREPAIAQRLVEAFQQWSLSVDRSHSGHDYPGGLRQADPPARSWFESGEYAPWMEMLRKRPEYRQLSSQE
ncbi:MAG: N-acetylgalactosamine 6-sulfate sulfatase [Chitinophagia bacterium]|nr:N-acetylgalactosamine 6-sulfate sulfatase [Chitinophagia bacterium]